MQERGTATVTRIRTLMAELASYLPLFIWLSPAFPVGAYAYSHALEWAVEDGAVADAASLALWLADLFAAGAMRADAVLLAMAWRAADAETAIDINELALALSPSRERALETGAQGTAFLAAIRTAWPAHALERFAALVGDEQAAYPVAVGVAAAAHGLPLRATLEVFTLAAVSNLVSAALRLGSIGQSEAQAILAVLSPTISGVSAFAERAGPDDLGTCAFRADIASMRHETQYSRLFRS